MFAFAFEVFPRVIMDDRTIPLSCADHEAVQSNEADQR